LFGVVFVPGFNLSVLGAILGVFSLLIQKRRVASGAVLVRRLGGKKEQRLKAGKEFLDAWRGNFRRF